MGKRIPVMLTVKEVSERVHLPVHFIRTLIWGDTVPNLYVKAGNRYLANLGKLVDYLNGEVESPAPASAVGKIRDLSLAK